MEPRSLRQLRGHRSFSEPLPITFIFAARYFFSRPHPFRCAPHGHRPCGSESVIAAAYQATTFPEDVARVTEWVRDAIDLTALCGAEDALAAVACAIRKNIKYRRREAKGLQAPIETSAKAPDPAAIWRHSCWKPCASSACRHASRAAAWIARS